MRLINHLLKGRTILAGLLATVIVTAGSLAVVVQPASAAPTYRTVRVFSLNTYLLGATQRKAMAVQNASTANGALLLQYAPSAAAPDNDWMVLEIEPGNIMRIKPLHTFSDDGNPHNDKCLAISGNASGWNRQIVNWTCSYDSVDNDVWIMDTFIHMPQGIAVYQFRNLEHGTCIVVQNASTANNARLITHTCVSGNDNHYWVW